MGLCEFMTGYGFMRFYDRLWVLFQFTSSKGKGAREYVYGDRVHI